LKKTVASTKATEGSVPAVASVANADEGFVWPAETLKMSEE
jgi:hypothetical protein